MLQLAARVYNLLDELAAQEDGPVLLWPTMAFPAWCSTTFTR